MVTHKSSKHHPLSYSHKPIQQYEFPGDDTPVVFGSALKALEGDTSDIGIPSILKLVEALDTYIPTPERDTDKTFLMPIEDVFSISGRGTVVTGRIERGVVNVGGHGWFQSCRRSAGRGFRLSQ